MGEVPVAFVAVADGGNVDALLPALQAQVDQALARFKRPVTYHFLDSLPRNPIGKIDKPALRRWLEQAARPVAAAYSDKGEDHEIRTFRRRRPRRGTVGRQTHLAPLRRLGGRGRGTGVRVSVPVSPSFYRCPPNKRLTH